MFKSILDTSLISYYKRKGYLEFPHSKNITKQLFKNYFLSFN